MRPWAPHSAYRDSSKVPRFIDYRHGQRRKPGHAVPRSVRPSAYLRATSPLTTPRLMQHKLDLEFPLPARPLRNKRTARTRRLVPLAVKHRHPQSPLHGERGRARRRAREPSLARFVLRPGPAIVPRRRQGARHEREQTRGVVVSLDAHSGHRHNSGSGRGEAGSRERLRNGGVKLLGDLTTTISSSGTPAVTRSALRIPRPLDRRKYLCRIAVRDCCAPRVLGVSPHRPICYRSSPCAGCLPSLVLPIRHSRA